MLKAEVQPEKSVKG